MDKELSTDLNTIAPCRPHPLTKKKETGGWGDWWEVGRKTINAKTVNVDVVLVAYSHASAILQANF